MIIKYDADGEIEWAKGVGGSSHDEINSVVETSDGGYIAGGYFNSSTIDLGNGVILNKNGSDDGMIIKYSSEGEIEWAKGIGEKGSVRINSIIETTDGGYIAGGYFGSYGGSSLELENGIILNNKSNIGYAGYVYTDGILIKYNKYGKIEWAKGIGGSRNDQINSVASTSDGGYIVGGYFGSGIDLGNRVILNNNGIEDGMIIKYSSEGEIEWAKGIGGSSSDYITSVSPTAKGEIVAGGYFNSSTIDLENEVILNNQSSSTSSSDDGMILKIVPEMGVPDVQEVIAENNRKEFKITTDVQEIDGIKGGSISGEDSTSYEKVKYGDTSTKEIQMIPDENYEIIGITVNGEEYIFTANEDGTYTMPQFENMTEDKHIIVTYSLKDNKITINKVDSETRETLSGVKFKLDQLEERTEPENVIGELTVNGQEYTEIDTTKEVTDALGLLIENGQLYDVKVDTNNEITGVTGNLTNNGTYYFVEQDGKYVPTNSKTYQTANGGTDGKPNVTANSYIPIDLTGVTGQYAVTVNAQVSSQSGYDYGYATITENTTSPTYNSSTGRFMYISGTQSAKDYTTNVLEGGKVYYLHLGYRKNGSVDTNDDQVVINSVKVYGVTSTSYNFIENNGKYESTNQGKDNTVANSYIPIDLRNKTGKYAVIVNAQISSQIYNDFGYVTVTENTTRPVYYDSTGRLVYISGTQSAEDYSTILQVGKMYYLHLGYYKNASTSSGYDKFTVNSIKLYETKVVTYNFIENEGKYESSNQGKDNTVANSYIPIDLRAYFGKYNLIVNAEISSQNGNDYGYVTVTENTTRPVYYDGTGRFVYISGTQNAKDYSTVLQGGKMYYLHLGYYKNASTSSGDDKFTVNSIKITLNDSELYHTEVITNSQGQAITQIPFGKYAITEIEAPERYELLDTPIEIEFRADENHEFTIENQKKPELIVHHYLKDRDGNYTETEVAEDDVLEGKIGEKYVTTPHLDLEKYELEKDESGEYVVPENATGTYEPGAHEVIYYYEEKEIPLTVHHYIEGTATQVPLKDGNLAEDEKYSGKEGESYTTSEIPNEELSDEYELVVTPENRAGIYSGTEITVIYYYKKVERSVTLIKYQEDGVTPLEGVKFRITKRVDGTLDEEGKTDENQSEEIENVIYTTNAQGKIEVTLEAGTYEITEIEVPEGYKLPENPTREITITRETTAEEIEIINEKVKGTVIVHHYLEGTTERVMLSDGNEAQDEIKVGNIGDLYASKTNEEILRRYELVAVPQNSSGEYIEGNIDVIYYYRLKEASVLVHHYKAIANEDGTYTYTEESISEDVTINGKVDDSYETEVATDIPEYYELIAVPENAEGTMTGEQIEVIYYYKLKEYGYVVNYLEKDDDTDNTNNKVLHEQKVVKDAKFGDTIIASDEVIDIYGYNYDSVDKENITINTNTEENVINIFYTKKDTKVTVHYYIEGTTEKVPTNDGGVVEDTNIPGKVFDEYSTTEAENVSEKYELVKEPENAKGTMTEDEIEVIYYYRLKDASLIVKYLEKGTNEELASQNRKAGKVDEEYKTEAKEIPNYTLVEDSGNTEGKLTVEPITVIYYYSQNTKVIVNHIDKNKLDSEYKEGDEIPESALLLKEEESGVVGDPYKSSAKDFEGYVIDAETIPTNAEGTMAKEEIIVNYYYVHISAGVIEKHIDINSNEILDSTVYEGNEGTPYSTSSKEFAGYEIATNLKYYNYNYSALLEEYDEKTLEEILNNPANDTMEKILIALNINPNDAYIPKNYAGTMTIDPIEVKYYYIRPASVRVEYIDKITGEKIPEKEVDEEGKVTEKDSTVSIHGHEGDYYKATKKDFEGYDIVKEMYPENTEGEMKITINEDGTISTETVIKYYYVKKSAGVIERHLDIKTGKLLEKEIRYEGHEGDEYSTKSKEFEGYDIVTNKMYYEKCIKENSEILKENGVTTVEELIEKLGLKEETAYIPTNSEGTMKDKPIIVTYYYIRKAQVIERHIDEESGELLEEATVYNGHEGDSYKTKAKEFKGYEIIKEKYPTNAEGTMTVTVNEDGTVRTEIIVNYYYKKVKETSKPEEKPNETPKGDNDNNSLQTIINNIYNNITNGNNSSTQNSTSSRKTPNTGDNTPVITISTIALVVILNIIQLKFSKKVKYSRIQKSVISSKTSKGKRTKSKKALGKGKRVK